jgi:hypothetical protein
VVAVTIVLGLMLATAGHYLSIRSQVQAAADAAALAAAPVTFRPYGSGGNPAAEAARLAAANRARLVRCICSIDPTWATRRVEVEVLREVDLIVLGRRAVRAVAAAEFAPIELLEQMDLDWIRFG